MKLLMATALSVISFCSLAQQDNNAWRMNPEILKRFKGNNDSLQKQMHNYFQKEGVPINLLSNMHGNVAILPQDRMPCIVPNTKDISPIPNAWSGVTVPYKSPVHPIPNPALPVPKQSFRYNTLDNSLSLPTK
jgi:hypothetical protein